MSSPASLQIYLNSSSATVLNDAIKRNRMGMVINEPIRVPPGYEAHVSLVDAQIPNTWVTLQKYLLVRTNLKCRNQYTSGRFFGKIPVDVAQSYFINYVNFTNYQHPVSDQEFSFIEIGIYNEDGSDVSLGTGYDWSCTIQINSVKLI